MSVDLAQAQRELAKAILSPAGLGDIYGSQPNWEAFTQREELPWLQTLAPDRVGLYTDLIQSTWQEALSSIYPHTRRLFKTQRDWATLLDQYRREYPVSAYHLYCVAADFPTFLASSDQPLVVACRVACPFLPELAHYEWIEVAVQKSLPKAVSPALVSFVPTAVDALNDWRPVWNPDVSFEVYQVSIPTVIDHILAASEDTCLQSVFSATPVAPTCCPTLIYRKPGSQSASFLVVTPLMAAYYQATLSESMTYGEGLTWLRANVPTLADVSDEVLTSQVLLMLEHAEAEGLLLGSIPVKTPKKEKAACGGQAAKSGVQSTN